MNEYTVFVKELIADYACSDDDHPVTVNNCIQGYIIEIACDTVNGFKDYTYKTVIRHESLANKVAKLFLCQRYTMERLNRNPAFLNDDDNDAYCECFYNQGIEPWSEAYTNEEGIGSYFI